MLHLPFADIYINFNTMIAAGLSAGIITGFFGLSGSLILAPLLNVLGLPAVFAAGTNLTFLFGQSVLTGVKNSAARNVSWRFTAILGAAGVAGAWLGFSLLRSLQGASFAGTAFRTVYASAIFGIAAFMTVDQLRAKDPAHYARQFERLSALAARIRGFRPGPRVFLPDSGGESISLWPLLGGGFLCGFLSGSLGLSGSFIRIPFLVFILGLPMLTALCTDVLVTTVITGAGAVFYAGAGLTEPVVALILLISAGLGAKAGFLFSRYAGRARAKMPFLAAIALFGAGIILRQFSQPAAAVILPGTLAALSLLITCLALTGLIQARKGASPLFRENPAHSGRQ
ncbi:MAG: sulfite exporter TauE/SafE family protein [Firmicutes bacterium]|nr:sulfite exporter TauE/SafE family protein [Bacillota bacterium]